MRHKELIHPVFLRCCQLTPDLFWQCVFENLAYGNAPYGTYVHKGSLCCRIRGSRFSYKIGSKSPDQLYAEVRSLLTEKRGMTSPSENAARARDMEASDKRERESHLSWSCIKRKSVRQLYLELFVASSKEKYGLSPEKTRQLSAAIAMGRSFKLISQSSVVFEDGAVSEIGGVRLFDGGFELSGRLAGEIGAPIRLPLAQSKYEASPLLADLWPKYLKSLPVSQV